MSKKLCILDYVGTLYNGTAIFENAKNLISALQSKDFDIIILSNSPLYSKQTIINELQKSGITDLSSVQVYPISLLASLQLHQDHQQKLFCICDDLLKEELKSNGFEILLSEDHSQVSIEEVPLIDGIDAVVVSIDHQFNTFKAGLATRYVIEKKTNFYSVGGDRRFKENGPFYPGSFTLATSIETPSFKSPVIIGKPNVDNVKLAFDFTKYQDIIVIGDNVDTDIEFGRKIGAKTYLVMTGSADRNDNMDNIDFVCKDLAEVVNKL